MPSIQVDRWPPSIVSTSLMKLVVPDSSVPAIDDLGMVEHERSAALRGMRRFSISTPAGIALRVYLLAFDIETFSFEAFAASGIACPPSVARSVSKRQAEFYFGRLAARQALEALGARVLDVGIGTSRQPLWPVGVIGSISHTRTDAAAVALRLGECSGVGIDLEPIAGPDACAALSATVVDKDELIYLEALADAWPISTLLTTVFSAKESLFKAAFGVVGRYFDFSAARVCLVDPEQGIIRLRLTETLCDAFVREQICEIGFCFIKQDVVLTHFAW